MKGNISLSNSVITSIISNTKLDKISENNLNKI